MKKEFYLFGLSLLFYVNLNAQTPYFYYYNGEKHYLELDTKHIFVSVANETAAKALDSNNMRYQSLRVDISEKIQLKTGNHKRLWTVLSFEDKSSDEAYLAKLSEIKTMNQNMIVAPYFKTKQQDKIGLSNFFLVRLKSLNDTLLLKQEVEKEHAVIVYQDEFIPFWFVASITERSKYNAMEMANRLYETGLFQQAVPDLMEDVKINCATDQYFGQQWGLRNSVQNGIDIKICDAWQISTGSNVTVAVLDQGIDLTHPDLATNIHPISFDSESLTIPQVIHGNHGTACAGIIGAARNNVVNNTTIGIAGVAPNCSIMSVSNSLSGTPLSRLRRANGINWAWQNDADIISNSWGSSVQYPEIDEAIDSAVIRGRGGRGCVVVFASGNDYASSVSYPANLPDVIAVGAINRNGNRADFSNYGTALDVVAPGVNILSTTLNNDYSSQDGTSFAAPHVAGIAALILSVRPDLTQAQVRHAIESTCTKLSGYSFSSNSVHPNGTWNNNVGHGLVNAYAAVYSVAPRITGPDVIGESCQAEYTANLPSNSSNVQWFTSIGLVVHQDRGINGATIKRSSNVNDPTYVNIFCAFTFDGRRDTISKNIQARIAPSIYGIYDLQCLCGVSQYYAGKYYYFVSNSTPRSPINYYLWTVTPPPSPELGEVSYDFEGMSTHLDPMYFMDPGEYTMTLQLIDGCEWSKVITHSFQVQESVDYDYYTIYPNPASTTLHFEIDQTKKADRQSNSMQRQTTKTGGACEVQLVTVQTGTLVLKQTVKDFDTSFDLDVTTVPNGLYILRLLQDGDVKQVQTIMVQH